MYEKLRMDTPEYKFESIYAVILDSGSILDGDMGIYIINRLFGGVGTWTFWGKGLKIGPELAQRVARTVPLECGSQNYFGYSGSSALQHGF